MRGERDKSNFSHGKELLSAQPPSGRGIFPKELIPWNPRIQVAPGTGMDKPETFPVTEMLENLPERFQKRFYGMFGFFLKNLN